MANNPTVVIGSLNDEELKKSIDKLVNHVDQQLNYMVSSTKVAVMSMNKSLKSLGDTKIDFGGSADGGASKRAKAQNAETDAVEKNVAARDKQIKKNQEVATSFDQMAKAQQVAIRSASPSGIRNADTLQTMNIQLDLLRERLREARQQYSSFVALAAHATTTGDKGLFQYATDGVHRYEQEVRNLIPQIRTLQSGIQQMGDVIAPQGHAIQNYVNSLQKANPELAALNAQYKSGTSLLQDQSTSYASATQSAQRYTEEIRKQAQAIRESKQWKETGTYSYQIGDATYYISKKQGEIEAQLVRHKEQQVNYQKDYLTAGMAVEQNTKQQASTEEKLVQAEQQRLGIEQQITQEKEKQKKKYTSPTSNEWVYNQSLYNNFIKNRLDGKTPVSWKENTSDINTLNAALSQLRKVYSSLTSEERAHPYGQSTLDQIQRIERKLNVLRSEMSRPLSFNAAMGLPEKTLDDIAYKMQRLRAYKQGIDLTKPNATNEIRQVDEALAKLQKDADKWMSKSNEMIKSNTALGRSWNYMKNRLAFYFTVGASTQFIKNLIEVRSQYEMNERALGILINSAERGKQIFQELSNMALVSPYTLIELSTAAKQLTAYDIAAKDVVDTTRRLADMAAAVGIPIERLTYALGQIKAYGYLNARDARMFSNAGIPLVKQLSEYYTELEGKLVSTADVYDRIKKKAIGYNDVMQVVNKMTDEGGKFFDFQAKMADTLKVRLANLTLAWNNMLNEIGQDSQGLLNWGIGALKNLFLQWKNFESALNSLAMAGGLIVAIRALNVLLVKSGVQWGILSKQMTTAGIAGGAVAGKLATVGASLKALVTSPMTWWTLLAFAIVDVTRALMNMDEAQKKLNQSIRDGAKDNYENVSKFLEQYKDIRSKLYSNDENSTDIDNKDAKKVWESIKEQIELTTKSANDYIGSLVKISNMSERIRKGFAILEDIAAVNAALKDAGDDAVKISGDFMNFFGLTIGDGLITNLKDYADKLKSITDQYGSLENAQIAAQQGVDGIAGDLHNLDVYLGTLQVDLKKTTDSILNFIQLKGWSGDVNKISETFSIAFNKIALENNLTPQQATQLRVQAAQAEYDAIQNALQRHIADENVALSKARNDNERADIESRMKVYKDDLSFMQSNTAQSRVYWEDFTKWMNEQHKSEVQAMFKGQSAEQIKMLDFTKGEYNKWVVELAQKYAKEHGMSYKEVFDQLHNYILNANQWSIRIPVMLDIQNLSWLQEDFKNRLPESSLDVSQYKTLSSAISDWQKKRKEGLEEIQRLEKAGIYLTTGGTEADREHYAEVQKEVSDTTAALKAYKAELTKGSGGKKKDPILDALKLEASLVEKLQSEYDKLTKSGASQAEALETIRGAYGKTIRLLNAQLGKYGLPQLDISQLITGKDPNKALAHFKQTLDTLVSKGMLTMERSKELEAVVEKFTLSAKTYNLDMITKGLNNELGKLKDEYELAVAIDADPELGNAFADMMGINVESLPHTVKEYADEYSKYLNKYLKGKNSSLQFTGDELRGLTRDDINALQSQVDAGSFNQEWFDAILKAYEDVSGKRKKDLEDTEKWKNGLIEKYGNLQDKLTKIYKDSVQNQVNAVKSFGTEDQKSDIVRLQLRLEATDNPAELTEINTEIAEIVKDVTDKNPIALKLVTASSNQTKSDVSKAYWEDFKNSDMYTMTFEDMANNSTRAIELIIDKLNSLKDHVKEDPASMKALIKSLEDAEKELNARDPFGGIARSLKNMEEASKETKTAQEALWRSEVDVEQAQQAYDNAEDGTPEERAAAQQRLADAIQKRSAAEVNLTRAESKHKKAQENLKSSLQGVTGQLGNVKSLFDTVSSLFRAGGDDETADAIDAISEGFSVMTTVIMGVVSAMVILESSQPWLLAIAAALSVIVGLVSFLSGSDNKKIDRQVEQSELAVKRLELAYIDLEHAVKEAYGMATIGANMAAKANKELQLAELKRQLALERSRDSKDRDEGKILDLQKQIKELEYEIADTANDIVNDLLGISSVGDAMESLMDGFVEALRNGEDAMAVFDETIDDMIANMVKKMFVTKILQPWFEEQWNKIQDQITKRAGDLPNELAKVQSSVSNAKMADVNNNDSLVDALRALGYSEEQIDSLVHYFEDGTFDYSQQGTNSRLRREYEKALKEAEEKEAKLQKDLTTATTISTDDIRQYAELLRSGQPIMDENMKAIEDLLKELGLMKDGSDKNLSALQQGIQGITEDTAGALEAYMNGVSQQVYLHSDLLTQIRDAVVGIDIDVQVATQAQMLLQLQQSYAVQMAIQGILEGWNNPSGQAVRVELVS